MRPLTSPPADRSHVPISDPARVSCWVRLGAWPRRPSSPARVGVLWAALIALLPWQACYAYIDPSAAGPIYQILLPLLVAIASGVAAFRRSLKRTWRRFLNAVASVARGADAAAPRDPPS